MSMNPQTINCEPDWSGMFDYVTAIVNTELPEDKGREAVKEMLAYGKRLHEAQIKEGE